MMPDVALRVNGVTKEYPGVTALDGVDLEVGAGEVHALVGENGAGKSTLVRILGGVHPPDQGSMTLMDRAYAPARPEEALHRGVRVVHQELSALPNLTVAENLFLNRLPSRRGWVNYRGLNERAARLLSRVGLTLPPNTRMERLSIAQTQLVEIARVLSGNPALVIFDEPTATLTAPERDRLFELVRGLRDLGSAIIYISHHLEEIFKVCDRATVLRNGQHVDTQSVDQLSTNVLVRMMVGRELADDHPFPSDIRTGGAVLEVDRLGVRTLGKEISFAAHQGEILGVAGLVGAGRTETMRSLFGADPHDGGTVKVNGRAVRIRKPKDAVRAGISFATEDRKAQGLVLPMGSDVNISLATLRKVSRRGLLRRQSERTQTAEMARQMRVKVPSVRTAVGTLSGGNQQKVVLSRWLFRDSDVLIVDEPTRGIDVGARHEIYSLLAELARRGKAIVMVSSDLKELMGMCHRLLVFSRGDLVADIPRNEFDHEHILTLAYSRFVNEEGPTEMDRKSSGIDPPDADPGAEAGDRAR